MPGPPSLRKPPNLFRSLVMTDPIVQVDKDGAVALVTMNRPEALNALNRALRAALVTTFMALAEDDETEVVIFTGAGRAFTAGLDLKELGGNASQRRCRWRRNRYWRRPSPLSQAHHRGHQRLCHYRRL